MIAFIEPSTFIENRRSIAEKLSHQPTQLWVLTGEPLSAGGVETFDPNRETEFDYFLSPEKYAACCEAALSNWHPVKVKTIDYVTENVVIVRLANGHNSHLRKCRVETAYPDPKRTYREIPAAVYFAAGVTLI